MSDNRFTASNIHWHAGSITRAEREKLSGHRGVTIWFTGLPASGKSTLAVATEKALHSRMVHTYILDGDNIRHGLNSNLGFSPDDRTENIRRIGEVAKLFRDSGIVNLVAFISPYRKDRQFARGLAGDNTFIEAFVDCPLPICEQRDPKGSYAKARAGMIHEFTGISAPYGIPESPEIHLRTDIMTLPECVDIILAYLETCEHIPER